MSYVNSLMTYRPITSTPFLKDGSYCEIAPCSALKPYICCFWGNEYPQPASSAANRLVIPDTCMDIIIRVNYSDNKLTANFCTLDEKSYHSGKATGSAVLSTFGIRFFFRSAALFSRESFRNTKNKACFPDEFFHGITAELAEIVLRFDTLSERAKAAEKILIRRLVPERIDPDIMNSVNDMIAYNGRMKISEIAKRNVISERRMERIFAENIGISPKTLSGLIRYQLVWQEIVRGGADILDLTEKYGYTDQAHLLHDFRSRHGMTPSQAYKNLF